MKLSPIAAPSPQPANLNEGKSASAERLARAKAIAVGEAPPDRGPAPDPQVERAQNSIKKIKMRTQVSPDRHNKIVEELGAEAVTAPVEAAPLVETPVDDKVESIEPTQAASDATKPLSPQFAALAKQKRELQLERQKLDAEKQALSTQTSGQKSLDEYRARIKANALKVLQEEGVTYDQLTEQILASNDDREGISALEAKIKALEEGLDKKFSERDSRDEEAALTEMLNQAEDLAKEGDTFALIREENAYNLVLKRIYNTYKKTGRVLDVQTVMESVENELLERNLKKASNPKVQSRLTPATPKAPPAAVQQDRPNVKVMRTLTNRDGVSSTSMSKRERAIAAMEGRLKQ